MLLVIVSDRDVLVRRFDQRCQELASEQMAYNDKIIKGPGLLHRQTPIAVLSLSGRWK